MKNPSIILSLAGMVLMLPSSQAIEGILQIEKRVLSLPLAGMHVLSQRRAIE